MHRWKRQVLDINQTSGNAVGGAGLVVGGDFNGSISGGTFTGGNATSGSNTVNLGK